MQYVIGDVVSISHIFYADTRMTVAGYDKEGRVKCMWFDAEKHLRKGVFWEHNLRSSTMTINVPPDVLSAVQRWKNSTLTH